MTQQAPDELRAPFTGLALDEPLLRDRGTGRAADERVGLDGGHRDRDLGDAWRGHHAVLSRGGERRYV